jgi:hypothetical protein
MRSAVSEQLRIEFWREHLASQVGRIGGIVNPQRIAVLSIAALLALTLRAQAEERFGDFSKHKLMLKLESQSRLSLVLPRPLYLVLRDGVVSGCEQADPPVNQPKNTEGGKLVFYYLSFTDPAHPKPELQKENKAVFTFSASGWATDRFITIATVPFTVDNSQGKEMIKFADHAVVEKYQESPEQKNMSIFFAPMAVAPFREEVKCTVQESTLGFKNILK